MGEGSQRGGRVSGRIDRNRNKPDIGVIPQFLFEGVHLGGHHGTRSRAVGVNEIDHPHLPAQGAAIKCSAMRVGHLERWYRAVVRKLAGGICTRDKPQNSADEENFGQREEMLHSQSPANTHSVPILVWREYTAYRDRLCSNDPLAMASNTVPVTVAHGDGIGPEIMAACLHIMKEAGAKLDIETIEIGEKVYLRGINSGIEPSAWESLRRTKVFFKAPITTPQGGGFKSLNVTTRKTLGLYANIRPCVSYDPYIQTKHPGMDVVIVRENEEDLYAGIEHRQTDEVYQCLKLISRPGSEKIVRYAFEYALRNSRKKVTCFSKDNIMKLTDGLFHKVFDEIGADYPELEKEHWIVDIGAAKMADTPEAFDVIVMPNLYGDILSDVAAQIAGSVGLAGSANIGDRCAMFEAIHGSAPRRAGQNLANPSGLLHGGLLMLVHIGQPDARRGDSKRMAADH